MTAPQTPAVPPPAAGTRTPAGAQTPPPAGVTRADITPLDPDSDKGRDVAGRLSVVFDDVAQAIAGRKAADARRTNP